jgi:hypothetical protein
VKSKKEQLGEYVSLALVKKGLATDSVFALGQSLSHQAFEISSLVNI